MSRGGTKGRGRGRGTRRADVQEKQEEERRGGGAAQGRKEEEEPHTCLSSYPEFKMIGGSNKLKNKVCLND